MATSLCELDLISKKVHACKQNVTQGEILFIGHVLHAVWNCFFTFHDLFVDPFVWGDMKLFAKFTQTADVVVYIFLSVLVSVKEIHEPLPKGIWR